MNADVHREDQNDRIGGKTIKIKSSKWTTIRDESFYGFMYYRYTNAGHDLDSNAGLHFYMEVSDLLRFREAAQARARFAPLNRIIIMRLFLSVYDRQTYFFF